ncbi:MAG TPA: YbaK/EbsC family protein, partial [Acidimicrobiales bacterium]|nr:YbaK/EbsC family protein [Acidimicrobiales bacterium]
MSVADRPAVLRVRTALRDAGASGEVVVLDATTRTALDAAAALGVDVGQIASSLVFTLPSGDPVLVITSGRHRVDAQLVADELGVAELVRADADFVKAASGFSIGGVSPVGWAPRGIGELPDSGASTPVTVIDVSLADYGVVWAAAGHPHAVFPTTFDELVR